MSGTSRSRFRIARLLHEMSVTAVMSTPMMMRSPMLRASPVPTCQLSSPTNRPPGSNID
jgi:hypothetical protein